MSKGAISEEVIIDQQRELIFIELTAIWQLLSLPQRCDRLCYCVFTQKYERKAG